MSAGTHCIIGSLSPKSTNDVGPMSVIGNIRVTAASLLWTNVLAAFQARDHGILNISGPTP